MKLTKEIANLIYDMEYIIGSSCENPNSYNGYTDEEGLDFRYPVHVYRSLEDNSPLKFRTKVRGIENPEMVETMKYKFGSNHLWIGTALEDVLDMLEECFGIDFNELEEKRARENNEAGVIM